MRHQSSQSQLNPVRRMFPKNKIILSATRNLCFSSLLQRCWKAPKIFLLQFTESSLTARHGNKNEMPCVREFEARRMQRISLFFLYRIEKKEKGSYSGVVFIGTIAICLLWIGNRFLCTYTIHWNIFNSDEFVALFYSICLSFAPFAHYPHTRPYSFVLS